MEEIQQYIPHYPLLSFVLQQFQYLTFYHNISLEKDGKLFKIQVKFLGKDRRKNKNSVQITLRRTGLPSYQKKYVDYFALWDEANNGFFIIPNLGQSCLKLNINGKYKENFNNFALIS